MTLGVYVFPQSSRLGGSSGIDTYNTTTVTSSTVGLTVTTVVGSTSARRFTQIQNISGNVGFYCLLDGVTSAANSIVTSTSASEIGFLIVNSSSTGSTGRWENSGYTGNINCTAASNVKIVVTTSP